MARRTNDHMRCTAYLRRVGLRLPARSCFRSDLTISAISDAVAPIVLRETVPWDRQTNTVSTMDEPVPFMWMEAPISAGQGIDAEHFRPRHRG